MKKKEMEERIQELEKMLFALAEKVHEMEKEKKPDYFG